MRLLLAIVPVLVATGDAVADPKAAAAEEAKRLFDTGRTLAEQGNLVEACKFFAQSFDLDRAPGTMLNLGDCAESEGRPRRAYELYVAAAIEFEWAGQTARAQFARNRANTVLANYPELGQPPVKPALSREDSAAKATIEARPEEPRPQVTSRDLTPAKIVAALGLGTAAAAGGVWAYSYFGPIKEFENGSGHVQGINGFVITEDYCADNTPQANPSRERAQFDAACTAYDRTKWAIPVTIGFGVIGLGALIYIAAASPSKPTAMAVTPMVSPDGAGATLRIDW